MDTILKRRTEAHLRHLYLILPFYTCAQPYGQTLGDHTGLLQNHIWREEELQEKLSTLYHHKPQTFVDHVMQKTVSIVPQTLGHHHDAKFRPFTQL